MRLEGSRFAFRCLLVAFTSFAVTVFAQPPVDSLPPIDSPGVAPSAVDLPQVVDTPTVVTPMAPLPPAAPPAPPPFDGPIFERPKLTGDWFGSRSALRDGGITVDASTTQYYQGTASGGRQDSFQYGLRDDLFVNGDGEKMGLWKGLLLTAHAESRYGDSVNSQTGALMPANLMLAVPQPNGSVTALTALKATQFLSENMLVYGGRINIFDSFTQPITKAGGLEGFMNTALIFNPVYARTTPYTTYGAGFAYLHQFEPVFSIALFDTANTPTVSGFNNFFTNGVTILSALNLPISFLELPGHQGLSGTYSSGSYNSLQPTPYFNPITGLGIATTQSPGSWSVAYNFDQALYASPDDPKRVWGLFGNVGFADQNTNPTQWFSSVGFSGASPIQSRKRDSFGVGYYYLSLSNTLKDVAPKLLQFQNEQGFEVYYNIGVTPWFKVTPDLQFCDPFLGRVDSSILVGLRAKLDF